MQVRVTLEGVDRALAEAKRIGGEVEKKSRRAVVEAVLSTERDTKAAAPVDTGRLRSSYYHTLDSQGGSVATNLGYAPHQEFGTRYQSGKAHLFPAARLHAGRLLARLRRILDHPDAP